MLVKIRDVLVPHDIDPELLDFIIADKGESRFLIGMHIPESTGYRFCFDTAHIAVIGNELRVHSQCNSRTYQLHMYAWEHVYCLMPSAKAKQKLGSGWVSPLAKKVVSDPEFGTTWHSGNFKSFVEKHDNANS
jgi:hypothetical protein